ncbi:hypothetical protein [Parafrankia elaeagni]|uniref:hypothetical protein n=1 Tax=Parafrankia elaeagni TaxID=222534 RepID=UPI00036D1DA5|nr:hypothetical protein [Parafrankia elaeagni]
MNTAQHEAAPGLPAGSPGAAGKSQQMHRGQNGSPAQDAPREHNPGRHRESVAGPFAPLRRSALAVS